MTIKFRSEANQYTNKHCAICIATLELRRVETVQKGISPFGGVGTYGPQVFCKVEL